MTTPLKLMCVLAHPDDESLGVGGILAKYAAEGVETYLVTATRGEHGWNGSEADFPGPTALGEIREAELRAAAAILGLREVVFLDYMDGQVDQAEPQEAIGKIASHIRRVRPDVVVTFDPHGAYGHPDHIAISQLTTAAIVLAADAGGEAPGGEAPGGETPHRVAKFYYMVTTKTGIKEYQKVFGDLVMIIDGVERRDAAWEDWAITSQVDTAAYWQQVCEAVGCHQSQLSAYDALRQLPAERQIELWGEGHFYRVYSLVNGGRKVEADLFEGLRS